MRRLVLERSSIPKLQGHETAVAPMVQTWVFYRKNSPRILLDLFTPYRESVDIHRGWVFCAPGSNNNTRAQLKNQSGFLDQILDDFGVEGIVKVVTHFEYDPFIGYEGTMWAEHRTVVHFTRPRSALMFKLAYGNHR